MKTNIILSLLLICSINTFAHGDEEHPDVSIHTFENGETYTSCSFMIHSSLTQSEFKQFTKEAGNIAYFQPLRGASSLGKYKFDISISSSVTNIDQSSGAWNNTFAHPITDSLSEDPHWLGDKIILPHIRTQFGISDNLETGFYITKDFGANYGFIGANLKYTFDTDSSNLNVASRISHTSLFGPKDLNHSVSAIDILVSKNIWHLEPYAGLSLLHAHSQETTEKVDLKTVNVITPQALVGIRFSYKKFIASIEYDIAFKNTLSYELGMKF